MDLWGLMAFGETIVIPNSIFPLTQTQTYIYIYNFKFYLIQKLYIYIDFQPSVVFFVLLSISFCVDLTLFFQIKALFLLNFLIFPFISLVSCYCILYALSTMINFYFPDFCSYTRSHTQI